MSTSPSQVRDTAAVMACLKRALKIANAAQQQLAMAPRRHGASEPVSLFVDALNQYLYYFEQGLPDITTAVLQVRPPIETLSSVQTSQGTLTMAWFPVRSSKRVQSTRSYCAWGWGGTSPLIAFL